MTAVRLLAVMSMGLLLASCGGREAPLPTLPGPESTKLVPQVSGYIVIDRSGADGRGMLVLALPQLEETVVLPPRVSEGNVHFVSGPDREGRIVYVENHMVQEFHRLKTIRVDGTEDREIFQRPGDALWKNAIGPPSLAPEGGLAAFVWNAKPEYVSEVIGPLEIWDIEAGTGGSTGITAWNGRRSCDLSWFPGSEVLACVQLMEEPDAPASAKGFDRGFDVTGMVPVVLLLDVGTGIPSLFHVGDRPLVYPDGGGVLLRDASDRWWRIDVKTRHAERVSWPGDWRGPIALLNGDLVLYWGHPTEGSPVRHTKYGSPLVHKHAMGDLKIASLEDARFQTVVNGIDPRREVSFGVVGPAPSEPGRR